jgi:hypothetical protein
MADDPNMALEDLRRRIRGGARPLLDGLSNEELVAAHTLIREGEAEIINEACKPFLVRVLATAKGMSIEAGSLVDRDFFRCQGSADHPKWKKGCY